MSKQFKIWQENKLKTNGIIIIEIQEQKCQRKKTQKSKYYYK